MAHALWLAEFLVSARWLDVITPLLVVAFEALVNTSNALVTRQFRERVPAMTEDALRAVLRKAITDPEFRAIFASDDSIRERWPVTV